MIIGTGIDIIEIERIEHAIHDNHRFVTRFFSEKEQAYFGSRKRLAEIVAGNFAAKEAFSKALGTGIRDFSLNDVEVLRDSLGKPYINVHNSAEQITNNMGVHSIHVSISHCKSYAVANVILEG